MENAPKMEEKLTEASIDQELTAEELENVGGGWPSWYHVAAGRIRLGCAPTEEEMGLGAASIMSR